MVALRKESVDRNADRYRQLHESYQSLSARRAWIEILRATHICRSASVALRKESVDRNSECIYGNTWTLASLSARRAWIEITKKPCCAPTAKSLSARRAWIEIVEPTAQALEPQVALRKESVDRNWQVYNFNTDCLRSLSARRAWIEIPTQKI